jgi:hypothetical protein
MSQTMTSGTLAFVLIGAVVGLLWLELKDGKQSSTKRK